MRLRDSAVIQGEPDLRYREGLKLRPIDHILQRWRIAAARPWISAGARVLDIGCHQGEMFKLLAGHIGQSVGIDPLARPVELSDFRLLAIRFSGQLPFPEASFDVITLLATLEHMEEKDTLAEECRRLLVPLGRTVITVPQPAVEKLLELLVATRLADGMSLEEHHGFDPSETERLFCSHGFVLEHHSFFQLGMNNLFVFRRQR
jgi:2-polyprenyl-3-methyl-5-hydroxy-6-metoxy-1,4-benzoquinol methylase